MVSRWWQVGSSDRDLLVCMITYTLLASLVLTSFLSMPVTRFLADMLFDHDEKMILPSFWGSTGIMLVVGAVLYTVFLLFSGATLMQGALCLWLFLEMIVNWNAMSYLTAIKDYKSILYSFVAAVLVAFVTSCVLLALACPPVESLLFAVVLGYGVMLVWDVLLLHRYFPQSREHPWLFLQWVDQFLPLALTGLLTTIGLSAKNAILIVEFAKDLMEKEGKGLIEATLEAVRMRLRPILMTSLAFILGVMPLVISSGAGSGAQNAVGTGVMGGMVTATVLAIFFVPVFFVVVRRRFSRKNEDIEHSHTVDHH